VQQEQKKSRGHGYDFLEEVKANGKEPLGTPCISPAIKKVTIASSRPLLKESNATEHFIQLSCDEVQQEEKGGSSVDYLQGGAHQARPSSSITASIKDDSFLPGSPPLYTSSKSYTVTMNTKGGEEDSRMTIAATKKQRGTTDEEEGGEKEGPDNANNDSCTKRSQIPPPSLPAYPSSPYAGPLKRPQIPSPSSQLDFISSLSAQIVDDDDNNSVSAVESSRSQHVVGFSKSHSDGKQLRQHHVQQQKKLHRCIGGDDGDNNEKKESKYDDDGSSANLLLEEKNKKKSLMMSLSTKDHCDDGGGFRSGLILKKGFTTTTDKAKGERSDVVFALPSSAAKSRQQLVVGGRIQQPPPKRRGLSSYSFSNNPDNNQPNETVSHQAAKPTERSTKPGSSKKYIGVERTNIGWRASTRVEGKKQVIGYYDTAEGAAIAYDGRVRVLRGSRAVCNFPLALNEQSSGGSLLPILTNHQQKKYCDISLGRHDDEVVMANHQAKEIKPGREQLLTTVGQEVENSSSLDALSRSKQMLIINQEPKRKNENSEEEEEWEDASEDIWDSEFSDQDDWSDCSPPCSPPSISHSFLKQWAYHQAGGDGSFASQRQQRLEWWNSKEGSKDRGITRSFANELLKRRSLPEQKYDGKMECCCSCHRQQKYGKYDLRDNEKQISNNGGGDNFLPVTLKSHNDDAIIEHDSLVSGELISTTTDCYTDRHNKAPTNTESTSAEELIVQQKRKKKAMISSFNDSVVAQKQSRYRIGLKRKIEQILHDTRILKQPILHYEEKDELL